MQDDLFAFLRDIEQDIESKIALDVQRLQGIIGEALDETQRAERRIGGSLTKDLTQALSDSLRLGSYAKAQVSDQLTEKHDLTASQIRKLTLHVDSTLIKAKEKLNELEERLSTSISGPLEKAIDISTSIATAQPQRISESVEKALRASEENTENWFIKVTDAILPELNAGYQLVKSYAERTQETLLARVGEINDTVTKFAGDTLSSVATSITSSLASFILNQGEAMLPEMNKRLGPMVEIFEAALRDSRSVAESDEERGADDALQAMFYEGIFPALIPAAGVGAAFAFPMIISGAIQSVLSPYFEKARQFSSKIAHERKMSPQDIIHAYWGLGKDFGDVSSEISAQGYSDKDRDYLAQLYKAAPDITSLIAWLNWGMIEEVEFDEALSNMGLNEEWIQKYKDTAKPIPPIGDIINMVIRDTFDEEIVKDLNLDAMKPETFMDWADKKGLSEYWASKYWQSHWRLPEMGQATSFLHRQTDASNELARGPMTEYKGQVIGRSWIGMDEIKSLLKTLDILPHYWDQFVSTAYRVYSRVDVRRMNKTLDLETNEPVLSEAEVYSSYLDLGYDSDKAGKLTAFTLAYNKPAEKVSKPRERDLSLGVLRDLFQKELLDEDKLTNFVSNMGYDEYETELLVSREKIKRTSKILEEDLDNLSRDRLSGVITNEELYSQLGELNLPSSQEAAWLSGIQRKLRGRSRSFSKAEAEDLLNQDLITEQEYLRMLTTLGYSETQADLLLNLTIRQLTTAQITKLFIQELIDLDDYQQRLLNTGLSQGDTDLLIKQGLSKKEENALKDKIKEEELELERQEAASKGEDFENWAAVRMSTIEGLFMDDLISEKILVKALNVKGFTPSVTSILVESLKLRKEARSDTETQ